MKNTLGTFAASTSIAENSRLISLKMSRVSTTTHIAPCFFWVAQCFSSLFSLPNTECHCSAAPFPPILLKLLANEKYFWHVRSQYKCRWKQSPDIAKSVASSGCSRHYPVLVAISPQSTWLHSTSPRNSLHSTSPWNSPLAPVEKFVVVFC